MGLENNASLSFRDAYVNYNGIANRAASALGISVSDVIFYWRQYKLPIKKVGRPMGTIRPTFSDEEIDNILGAYYVCDGYTTRAEKLIHQSRQIITHYWRILGLPIKPKYRPKSQ